MVSSSQTHDAFYLDPTVPDFYVGIVYRRRTMDDQALRPYSKPLQTFRAHVPSFSAREIIEDPRYGFAILLLALAYLVHNELSQPGWELFRFTTLAWLVFIGAVTYLLYQKSYRMYIYDDGFGIGNQIREGVVWFASRFLYSEIERVDFRLLEPDRGRIIISIRARSRRVKIDSRFVDEIIIWKILSDNVDMSRLTDIAVERSRFAQQIRLSDLSPKSDNL